MSLNSFLLAFTTTADWLGFSSISFFFFFKHFFDVDHFQSLY